MAELAKFFVSIASQLDAKGFDATIKKIDEVQDRGKNLFDGFQKIGLGLSAAGAAGVAAFTMMAGEASKAEQAQAELAQAMKTAGVYTDEALASALAYASALQSLTGYSDEEIASTEAMLSRFGATGQQLEDLTKAVADFARAQQMDLTSAAALVAKSVGTETNALSRYGVVITGTAASTTRMESAVASLGTLFGGAAAAHASTFSGQLAIVKEQLSDVAESMGKSVLPIFSSLLNVVKLGVNMFNALPAPLRGILSVAGLLASGVSLLAGGFAIIVSQIPAFIAGFTQMRAAIAATQISINAFYLTIAIIPAAIIAIVEAISMWIDATNRHNEADARQNATLAGRVSWYRQEIARLKEKKSLTVEETDALKKYSDAINSLNLKMEKNQKLVISDLALQAEKKKLIDKNFTAYMEQLNTEADLAQDQRKMEEQMLADRIDAAQKAQDAWVSLGDTISSNLSRALESLIEAGELTSDSLNKFWNDIFEGFRDMLIKMLAEMAAKAIIFLILDAITGGQFGVWNKFMSNIGTFFPKTAEGGLITQPQIRSFAENGAELALPLESPRTAQLLARAMDQSTNFGAVNINISGGMGSRSEARRTAEMVGEIFIARVKRSRKL